ncbi:copper amine oxidase [Cohnella sp. CIP 111063]|uniref:C40 family peptidase n=1 Tax=unclassified Cohnella TaxID=2636738 RepID=UPI000B8C535A|nr:MULTISPECIES: stalk domain-containing protein [unclassified Cohnella]OXS55568.1 copper amine oxidase [Cohnella sp. CIP 111063]PRX66411.1 SH3 domain-containing protein [Cohnella sp. SGD-V74]
MLTRIGAIALLGLLLGQALPAHAHAAAQGGAPDIYVDGKKLALAADPIVVGGATLVPMRAIFEAQRAEVTWSNAAQTVSAIKDGILFTYRIGDTTASLNGKSIPLSQPGAIVNGTAMLPLRFIGETLGNVVQWHAYANDITISTVREFRTSVTYGVNLRAAPDAASDTPIRGMLAKGEKIQVLREIDAKWLEVRTQDDRIGFVSAKPQYTDYESPTLAKLQGDELIAFGSQYIGTPYEFGAALGQTDTFDCSSFVHHVFEEVLSVDLPRVSYNQAKEGRAVGLDELRVGDLLFFGARGLEIGHVGIYAGDNRILHTFSKVKGVHFDDFDEKWKKRFVTARRLI